MAQWARLAARHWRSARADVMGYGEPFGHKPLRQAIALHLRANRGIACDAEQIFIVGGAQQAFHLIGSTLLDPGDKVWFENPGAIGARNSLIASGADLVPVPVDEQGLRVADGLGLAPQFRLAFVTPSHQQPLGTVMSLERRFALLHAAEQAGAWIIEDDYDGEFSFGGPPLPTLKSVDATGLVIYVGTFSKSLFPSLRLGYLLAPPALVETFNIITSKLLHGVPTGTQAVVADFIDDGHFGAHLRRMRAHLRRAPRGFVPGRAAQAGRRARHRAQPERAAHHRLVARRPRRAARGGGRRAAPDHRLADRSLCDRAGRCVRAGAGLRRHRPGADRGRCRCARRGARAAMIRQHVGPLDWQIVQSGTAGGTEHCGRLPA